jgi:hypothetical protein
LIQLLPVLPGIDCRFKAHEAIESNEKQKFEKLKYNFVPAENVLQHPCRHVEKYFQYCSYVIVAGFLFCVPFSWNSSVHDSSRFMAGLK